MGPRPRPPLAAAVLAGGLACGDPASSPPATEPAPSPSPVEPTTGAPPARAPSAFEIGGLDALTPARRFTWPVLSVHITSSFGWRVDPVSGRGVRLHRGLDFRGAIGDLVISIGDGTVSMVGHDPFLGTMVIVDHGQGVQSLYGHLSDVLVVEGVPIERGAALGLVGNTGRSAAPHLHLTVKLDGVAIDPLELIGEPLHRPAALLGPRGDPAPVVGDEPLVHTAPGRIEAETPSPLLAPAPTLPHRSDDGGA